MIKLQVIGSNGKATGREFQAKDSDHAGRIEKRIKDQAGAGNSIVIKRTNV